MITTPPGPRRNRTGPYGRIRRSARMRAASWSGGVSFWLPAVTFVPEVQLVGLAQLVSDSDVRTVPDVTATEVRVGVEVELLSVEGVVEPQRPRALAGYEHIASRSVPSRDEHTAVLVDQECPACRTALGRFRFVHGLGECEDVVRACHSTRRDLVASCPVNDRPPCAVQKTHVEHGRVAGHAAIAPGPQSGSDRPKAKR